LLCAGCEKGDEPPDNYGIINTVFPLFVYESVEQHPFYGYSDYWLSVDSFPIEKYYRDDGITCDVLRYQISSYIDYYEELPMNAGIFFIDSVMYNSELYHLGWESLTKYEIVYASWYSIKDDSLCFFKGDTIMFGKFATFKIKNDTLISQSLSTSLFIIISSKLFGKQNLKMSQRIFSLSFFIIFLKFHAAPDIKALI
jgi:hypothetical protein